MHPYKPGHSEATMRVTSFTLFCALFVASPAVAQNQDDIGTAYAHIGWAWKNHGGCSQVDICFLHFDKWVGTIRFDDGIEISAWPRIWRGDKSAHECIVQARAALHDGQIGLAVAWVMASQIHNPDVYRWMRDHPGAVKAALVKCDHPEASCHS
jgi:hypothetical protein